MTDIGNSPKPQAVLEACAKLQKAGADLSKMVILQDAANMGMFWIVSKKEVKRIKHD